MHPNPAHPETILRRFFFILGEKLALVEAPELSFRLLHLTMVQPGTMPDYSGTADYIREHVIYQRLPEFDVSRLANENATTVQAVAESLDSFFILESLARLDHLVRKLFQVSCHGLLLPLRPGFIAFPIMHMACLQTTSAPTTRSDPCTRRHACRCAECFPCVRCAVCMAVSCWWSAAQIAVLRTICAPVGGYNSRRSSCQWIRRSSS